jgi:hypothetical protein
MDPEGNAAAAGQAIDNVVTGVEKDVQTGIGAVEKEGKILLTKVEAIEHEIPIWAIVAGSAFVGFAIRCLL